MPSRPPEPRPRPAEVSPAPVDSRYTRWLRLAAIGVAVVGLAVVGLRGRFPDPREFVAALAGAGYGWIALAALLQVVSLAAFAFQQRRLIDNLGVRLRRRHLMAITLARSALSITLPAGAAVSTGYAIREYRRAGVTSKIGAASQIVSGLASIGGLTLPPHPPLGSRRRAHGPDGHRCSGSGTSETPAWAIERCDMPMSK
jgi:hypothetical protein